LPDDRLARWYGTVERPQVHLPINFHLIENAWNAPSLRRMIEDYEASLPEIGWPNWVHGSHDAPRIAARVGEAQARVAAMLLLTLRGTPTLYQGDEIGIAEVVIPPDRVRDPQDLRQPGLGIGRDPSRTPIPWDASAYAGFSTVEPWLPLNEDWQVRNIATQLRDASSLLSLYRSLLALRRSHAAIAIGDFTFIDSADDVLSYVRRHADEYLLIALNLSDQTQPMILSQSILQSISTDICMAEVLASTLLPSNLGLRPIDAALAPNEGLILKLKEIR